MSILKHLKKLNKKKPIVYCGDMNVAHEEIDLKNPKSNVGQPGFSDEERAMMSTLIKKDFKDAYRTKYPDKVEYTWWSYRANARENNTGWRIDYFIVSDKLMDKVKDVKIHNEIYGSDHCPVELILK
jgi:exodeoxyribonuclease-3